MRFLRDSNEGAEVWKREIDGAGRYEVDGNDPGRALNVAAGWRAVWYCNHHRQVLPAFLPFSTPSQACMRRLENTHQSDSAHRTRVHVQRKRT